MANIYGRVAKISNAVGRSSYISDPMRQEQIVLHKKNMLHDWREHAAFEKAHQKTNVANNEALEVHFALPNNLYKDSQQLEAVCDELVSRIVGTNKDSEYAVHWNRNRTNLHVHILFSERENQIELEPKVYKKDIWHDKDTHRLAKAHAENAILVHRKGEVQKDKDGNIKYHTDIFKAKDTRYIQSSWVQEKNKIAQKVLKEYGFNVDINTKDGPYLSQKKLYKGARKDYLEKAKAWNNAVKKYNEKVKHHLSLNPEQYDMYMDIKYELTTQVREANSQAKKITTKAIELIKDMVAWVTEVVIQVKANVHTKSMEENLAEGWNNLKENYSDLFDEIDEIEHEMKSLESEKEARLQMNDDVSEVIESKNSLISDINRVERRKKDEFEL